MSHYISNDQAQFELLNLKINEGGKGPYLIRQEGIDGGGMDMKVGRFILQKDGTWMLNLKFATLPEDRQREALFADLAEVYDFVQTLTGKAKVDSVLPEGKSPEEIQAAVEKTVSKIWNAVREAKGSRLSGQ